METTHKYFSAIEEYPNNLLEAICCQKKKEWFDELFDADGEEQISFDTNNHADIYASLEYILFTLTSREKQVIDMRYRYGMNLDDIGKEYGVTRERIRQLIAKALRKLRHPSRFRYIQHGVMGVMDREIQMVKKHEYDRGYLAGYCQKEKEETSDIDIEKLRMNTPIEELDLSVRSYNCLKRSGIDTLGKIGDLTLDDLKHVRNLGLKSLMEIVDKVKEFGIYISEGEETNG